MESRWDSGMVRIAFNFFPSIKYPFVSIILRIFGFNSMAVFEVSLCAVCVAFFIFHTAANGI